MNDNVFLYLAVCAGGIAFSLMFFTIHHTLKRKKTKGYHLSPSVNRLMRRSKSYAYFCLLLAFVCPLIFFMLDFLGLCSSGGVMTLIVLIGLPGALITFL